MLIQLLEVLGWPKISFGIFWNILWKKKMKFLVLQSWGSHLLTEWIWFNIYAEIIVNSVSILGNKKKNTQWYLHPPSLWASWTLYSIYTMYIVYIYIGYIYTHTHISHGSDGKESAYNVGDSGLTPGSRRFPGEGNTPVFLPGEFHG